MYSCTISLDENGSDELRTAKVENTRTDCSAVLAGTLILTVRVSIVPA